MRILHVIHYYHEGFGYQENWLAAHQVKLGHHVLVVTSDHYFPFPEYEATMAPTLGGRFVGCGEFDDGDVPVIRKKSYAQNFGPPGIVWFSLVDELYGFRPDIIHLHGATSPLFFELIYHRKKLGYKLFVDSHQDEKVEQGGERLIYRAFYAFWRFWLQQNRLKHHVARFLPITVGAQTWLEKRLHLTHDEMSISPLGVDLQSMTYREEERNKFRRLHHLEESLVVVNAGKQYPGKRIDWVVEVASRAAQMGACISLVLVGQADADYDAKIRAALKQFSGTVLRLPFLDRTDLRHVYAGADVGIWPGIPSNTIQEAMAGRCALILPDDTIVGHLIEGNGLKTNTDVETAARYLVKLFEDPVQLRAAQERSAALAETYSWSSITNDLIAIYERYDAPYDDV